MNRDATRANHRLRETPALSSTMEDYVKRIYLIQQENRDAPVSMGKLAGAMGITPGTATTMVKSMADAQLITYKPRVGVKLTPKGESLALGVLRRHRIAEAFLVEVLGMDWAEVHDDAERLEHAISPGVLERMDALLNRPTHDPHGDPIPALDGGLADSSSKRLSGAEVGQDVTVSRILDQTSDFLTFLRGHGLGPGISLRILQRDLRADSMLVETKNGHPLAISMRVAAKITVTDQG